MTRWATAAGPRRVADTFSLSVPTFATHLKQTESKVVEIGIKRGKNSGQDFSLKFDGLPKWVIADPASPVIRSGRGTRR